MCLPDKRLTTVLDKFTDRISQRQHLTLRKLSQDRNEEVQFGRFIRNARVTMLGLEELFYEQFRSSCPNREHLLLIEDTSQLTFSLHRKITGLGKIDKGQVQGFYLHPVLCLNARDGACYGLASIRTYQRAFNQPALTREQVKEANYQAFFEDKESYRWYQAIAAALQNCPAKAAKTVIADREADIYPLLTGLQDLGVDYLIRARHNRPVAPEGKLYELVNTFFQQHCFSLPVSATEQRSAHTAVLLAC
jgi:hypothetical protein